MRPIWLAAAGAGNAVLVAMVHFFADVPLPWVAAGYGYSWAFFVMAIWEARS